MGKTARTEPPASSSASAGPADGKIAVPPQKEPAIEQLASFIGFFIYLLVLKTFFVPLFIIPTGSMAETLYGEHAMLVCPNCGTDYVVNWPLPGYAIDPARLGRQSLPDKAHRWDEIVFALQCPNCRWLQVSGAPQTLHLEGYPAGEVLDQPLVPISGDRIFVHGWVYDPPLSRIPGVGPRRWDVVVFKVPTDGETNYIKRLTGLPGEKIEFIDGDLFVNDRIETKPDYAQAALWDPYFNQDYPPRQAARSHYFPRWVALDKAGGWKALDARELHFDPAAGAAGRIQFSTDADDPARPGIVEDIFGYNSSFRPVHVMSDVRLSSFVQFAPDQASGYVELRLTKYDDAFNARLHADGRLTLEHVGAGGSENWGSATTDVHKPRKFSLEVVDYNVRVRVDDEVLLRSEPNVFSITPEVARLRHENPVSPVIQIAAEGASLTLRHVLIERDVFYSADPGQDTTGGPRREPNAGPGNPMTLRAGEYFVCGDNSPASLDARYWYESTVGPHLMQAYKQGKYRLGTVPADQMIGRAFFVYWPGPLSQSPIPLPVVGRRYIPDFGRIRWIH